MNDYDEAHDREQTDAALLDAIDILRRIGPGCVVCVMSRSGRVFRRISAADASTQAELMHLTARQMEANLAQMAMQAAEMVDSVNPPGYLDDIRQRLEEDEQE